MLDPKHFWVKKFGGGGVKTVGTSSLDYRKPTYQILASYYAWNPPKSFGWVVGGGYYTKFSVLLWAKALVLAWAQAEQLVIHGIHHLQRRTD